MNGNGAFINQKPLRNPSVLLPCEKSATCNPEDSLHQNPIMLALRSCTRISKSVSDTFLLFTSHQSIGFPGSSDGKESTRNVGDVGSIPGLGRFSGEGKGYSALLTTLKPLTVWITANREKFLKRWEYQTT